MSAGGENPCAGWALFDVDDAGLCFPLTRRLVQVGRSASADLRLDRRGVSKRHAILTVEPEGVLVEDLASKNGTSIDGRRISVRRLRAGHVLGIGAARLRLQEHDIDDVALALRLSFTPPATEGGPATSTAMGGLPDGGLDDDLDGLAFPADHVIGRAPAMRSFHRDLVIAIRSRLPVLILGETGSGKEAVARTVHDSSRPRGPFVTVNCAALPAELLEAELFGIGRGVATGVDARSGLLRQADGGTLFLDEVGDLPSRLQPKLLRALEDGEVRPLGGTPVTVDVRLVSATHTDLEAAIRSGDWRRDLYHRLAGHPIRVPTLRERPEDLPALVEHFLRRAVATRGQPIAGITHAALAHLATLSWPGNVRELAHEVARLVHRCPVGQPITRRLVLGAPRPSPVGSRSTTDSTGLDLARLERKTILRALAQTAGNRAAAARLLGIGRDALRRRLTRHGIAVEDRSQPKARTTSV